MDLAARKKTIRKTILAARDAMSVAERLACSGAITERIVAMPEYKNATTVLGYMNFGSEYASQLWVARALADGKRLVLPKVNRHTNELNLYRVEDPETQLGQGLWGIAEPLPERCERLNELNEVEFALLPGVAYTRSGARLGYGGGYYDRLLARIKPCPVLVAAAFALQIAREIPEESTDIRVDWVVTEQEIIACSK
jgi:5-formyltetrahydrofolate cyclo-ligase